MARERRTYVRTRVNRACRLPAHGERRRGRAAAAQTFAGAHEYSKPSSLPSTSTKSPTAYLPPVGCSLASVAIMNSS